MLPNQPPNPQQNKRQSLAKYAKFSAFAFQMIGLFVGLSLGGNWLDEHWAFTFPYFTLAGVFLALIAIFYSLYNLVRETPDEEKKQPSSK